MKFFWLTLFFSFSALAADPYVIKDSGFHPVCDDSKIEIKNLPPIRDQGGYGLCYAHSAMLLLEFQRCSNEPNPTSCYNNKGSVLHLARYNNTRSEDLIKIGGDPVAVFTRFLADRKLVKESCAEYDDWKKLEKLYRDEKNALVLPDSERHEVDFFYYISRQIKQNKATQDDLNCWTNDLISAGVNQSASEIMNILSKAKDLEWKELRYQILVPKSCFNQTISYPEYRIDHYPKYNETKSFKGFRDYIYKALSQGIPVEASFKASENSYHTAVITGQRHVCNRNKCELQWRIQNSYGRSWQDSYDDGWVSAKNLADHMSDHSMGVSTIMPKAKQLPAKTAPYYENSPVSSQSQLQSGCWKVSQGSQQYITNDQETKPSQTKPTPTQNYGEKGVWRCKKDGQTIFGEFAIQGADCKKIQ